MNPKAYLGIDPGQGGAVALISRDQTLVVDWPALVDWSGVRDLLCQWKMEYNIRLAALERVAARPGQGVRSVFSFGKNAGGWEAALSMARIPWISPTPQAWQKGVVLPSDGPDPKTRALTVARRLFPEADLSLKRHDGRADALLLAAHARSLEK
ncbi:MAG: hypothetical protein EA399_07825 [Desulfovibrionales bacterium]|nr:MAG: hypothetical protein EA399_07825 [Desulfovibrionales bacterium]